jgi:glutamate-1-semialdehyde 2,1-aminomutase
VTSIEEYRAKHPRSAELHQQAQGLFPDGVTHDTRYATPFPITVTHGKGSRKWDVDGNEYIDYVMGHGALLLGHAHPEIVTAVTEQMARGTHLGASHLLEQEWGRLVQRLIPSAEKVRFTSSGTEATMMALRLARAYTGKSRIIKFAEHFHGWSDSLLAGAGRGAGGIPEATWASMLVLSPNDIDAVEEALRGDDDIAGIILEPTGAHMGRLPLAPTFLQQLREAASRHDVVLIFDEVVTGFRVSVGGAQAWSGVTPDLTTLAKILGGGLPGGAVTGQSAIMDMISHRDDDEWDMKHRVSHPGTFNGNPVSAAAGVRCLELVASGEPNARADAATARLIDGVNGILARMEIPGCCYGQASLFHLRLGRACVCGQQGTCTASHAEAGAGMSGAMSMGLKRAMLNAGVDLMGGRGGIVSATHTDADVDQTLASFEEGLDALRRDGLL